MAQLLASEASTNEQRWITAHAYCRKVLREHFAQQARRLAWEAERRSK